jgi:hypothetical protein
MAYAPGQGAILLTVNYIPDYCNMLKFYDGLELAWLWLYVLMVLFRYSDSLPFLWHLKEVFRGRE